jgi:molybdopterin molybdotransferase
MLYEKRVKEVRMIPFEEALGIVMESALRLNREMVPLEDACGRILYEDIYSDIDMPPFDKSAMDGYACRSCDLDRPLKVVETIAAGCSPLKIIGEGECAKIMTGAAVPDGADCVVMVEHTETKGGMVFVNAVGGQRNICYRAEDIRAGDIVLREGTLIRPPEVAVLAAVGCDPAPVARRPVMGVVATGSELVEPSSKPEGTQIRNSNGYQLCSNAEGAGCRPVYFGIVSDSRKTIGRIIEKAVSSVDVLLVSGGVSMGEYDYVPGVLKENGFELLFEKVAVKPGKPTVFGKNNGTYVFGMPGNPVSAFIIFELFVKPFCFRLMGGDYRPVNVSARLSETVKRREYDRLEHIPVLLSPDGGVRAVDYHGSAHIHAYTVSDGFISIPVGIKEVKAGEVVQVTLIG